MKKITPYTIDLYVLTKVEWDNHFGHLIHRNELIDLHACLEEFRPRLGQLRQCAINIDPLRDLALKLANPNESINASDNAWNNRPKDTFNSQRRLNKHKCKYFWHLGGAAEYEKITDPFNSFEKALRDEMRHAFSLLAQNGESDSIVHWSGYAGVTYTADYSLLGATFVAEGVVQPSFKIMRDHDVEAAFPEKSWTSATLDAEDAQRSTLTNLHRLAANMDYISPRGITNGLEQVAFVINTELYSQLCFDTVDSASHGDASYAALEQKIGALYEAICLSMFKAHLGNAFKVIDEKIGYLSDQATHLISQSSKRCIEKRIKYYRFIRKPLVRAMMKNFSNLSATNAEVLPCQTGIIEFHHIESSRRLLWEINKFESALRDELNRTLSDLHEACNERMLWGAPDLKFEIQVRLPEPYFDSSSRPLQMKFDLSWNSMLSNDQPDEERVFPDAHPLAGEKIGYLAQCLINQSLPMWSWRYIKNIEVKAGLSASMIKHFKKPNLS